MEDIRPFFMKHFYVPVLIFDFILCGFIGWTYETVITSIAFGRFTDRGVLPVPVLPIYGLFALILPLIFKREHNPFLIFFGSAVGATVFELAGAYVTEAIWHERLWHYGDWKFNFFDGRISLFSSLIFGGLCLLFVKAIHPFSLYLNRKAQKAFAVSTSVLAAVLIVLCFVLK